MAHRSLQILVTLFLYLALVFFLMQALPGDITTYYVLNPHFTPEQQEAIRRQLGLDQGLLGQFFTYLKNFFTGNLGVSFQERRPVWDIILERLPRTVVLFLTATLLSFYIGFLLGKIIAWKRGRLIEYMATLTGITFYTAFTPLLALILIWVFAFSLGWFPLNSFVDHDLWRQVPISSNTVFNYMIVNMVLLALWLVAAHYMMRALRPRLRPLGYLVALALSLGASALWWKETGLGYLAWDIAWHMVLPVLTVTLISFGGTMLLMRDSMLETVREDYVLAARAKGLPERVVRDKHAARTALLPVMTSFVLSIGFVFNGGIITETLFSWPGIGLTLLTSVQGNDYPLAVGAFVFTGVFALIAHLVADILYAYLDPRIQYE